jgi:hypothetical protein
MKNQSIFAMAAMVLTMTACMENGLLDGDDITAGSADGSSLLTTASYDASTEAMIAASFEDVDETTDEAIERYFQIAGGRMLEKHLDCADVTRDTVNQTITIDFGEGCEDRRGVVRSGKIQVVYNGTHREPGSYKIITFEDFVIDSIQVEGTRTATNVTDTTQEDGLTVYETSLVGGKLTFADGTTITREANHTRTKYHGETREDSYATLTGSASGTLQDETDYNMEITTEILISGACGLHVHVSGVKEFVAGETAVTIDFGDGTCDNLADVTINGETTTIELESKAFGGHKGKRGRSKGGRHGGHGFGG